MSICFFLLFLGLDGPPLFFQFLLRAFFPFTKNVGMPADHFFIDVLDDVPEGKMIVFCIDFSHENQEKEHIAEFFTEVFIIVIVDGGNYFGKFILEIFFQTESGLFLIPGAAVRAKQGAYGVQKQRKVMFISGHGMVLYEEGRTLMSKKGDANTMCSICQPLPWLRGLFFCNSKQR